MNLTQALALARKHLNNSSARACMADAIAAHDRGDHDAAWMWAVKSLKHSVGICHGDYKRAAAANYTR